MYSHRWLPLFGAVIFASACSSAPVLPNNSSPSIQAVRPMVKSFGVSLTATAALTAGDNQWSQQFCATNSSSNCSGIVEHKKSVGYKAAQSGTDTINGGHFTLKTNEVSAMGQSSYNVNLTAHGGSSTPGQDGASLNPTNLGWSDNLHVKSSTLPKGTPVTISVQLVLAPSATNVSCSSDQNSSAGVDFTGTGNDQFGFAMELSGGCASPGSFVYVVGNQGRGGQGTTDTGVIDTKVGATVGIAGSGYAGGWACTFTPVCDGHYVTDVAGTVTWKITGVSPNGVTYTTDSGGTYQ